MAFKLGLVGFKGTVKACVAGGALEITAGG
jgi:hypothetical protein